MCIKKINQMYKYYFYLENIDYFKIMISHINYNSYNLTFQTFENSLIRDVYLV